MLDYSTADLGLEAPEEDISTHLCGCGQRGCPDCNPRPHQRQPQHPGATAPAWWLAQPLPGEADDALPF